MKLVISGYRGFLGRNIIARFIKQGIPYLEFSYNDQKRIWRDICDESEDFFIHLADPYTGHFDEYRALGIENEMSNIAKSFGPRFIYVSSALVYCRKSARPRKVSDPVCSVDSYTNLKLRREQFIGSMNGTILRLANVYGIGMHKDSVISKILLSHLQSTHFSIGKNSVRDFVHIEDVVELFEKISKENLDRGGIYNVGTGRGTSLSEIYAKSAALSGLDASLETSRVKFRESEDTLILDIDKENSFSWWHPKRELEPSLTEIYENYRRETLI